MAPEIRPASAIDSVHGFQWTVRASDAPNAVSLARFESLDCAETFLADLLLERSGHSVPDA